MSKPNWITFDELPLTDGKYTGSGDKQFKIKAAAHSGRSPRTGSVTVTGNGLDAKVISLTQNGKPIFITLDAIETTVNGGVSTVNLDKDANEISVPSSGKTFNLIGTSNAPFLNFRFNDGIELLEDAEGYTYQMKYYSVGLSTPNTAPTEHIEGNTYNGVPATKLKMPDQYIVRVGKDLPIETTGSKSVGTAGEQEAYNFALPLTIGENKGETYQKVTLQITTGSNNEVLAQIIIKLNSAGEPKLELYKDQYHTIKCTSLEFGAEDNLQFPVYIDANVSWIVE